MKEDLTLEDLATHSGLPLRTLRYYIQEGILQGPDSRGKYARYSQEHLDRIELIQRLKNLRLPLQEIAQIIDNMTPDEISKVRQYQDILKTKLKRSEFPQVLELRLNEDRTSALEYIHDLEDRWQNVKSITRTPGNQPPQAQSPIDRTNYQSINDNSSLPVTTKEDWTRFIIKDGLELNIRRRRGSDEAAKIADLIAYARKLFSDRS